MALRLRPICRWGQANAHSTRDIGVEDCRELASNMNHRFLGDSTPIVSEDIDSTNSVDLCHELA
eukprot:COSAG01_NODE_69474_length_261_cov_0.641975_1_plen_63_part_10